LQKACLDLIAQLKLEADTLCSKDAQEVKDASINYDKWNKDIK
jgi:hypothetical protein